MSHRVAEFPSLEAENNAVRCECRRLRLALELCDAVDVLDLNDVEDFEFIEALVSQYEDFAGGLSHGEPV